MKSRKTSFQQFVQELSTIYESLISTKLISDDDSRNFVIETLNFLSDISNVDELANGNLSKYEIFNFFSLLLDGVGLVFATEGSTNPINLGDTKLIGRKRDLMGVYKGPDNQILQNMCATLFQGWVKSSNQEYLISKDMKNVLPDDKRSCDYLVEGKNILPTLVECKRIHPGKHIGDRNTLIQEICEKSEYMIDYSLRQLKSTAEYLGSDKYAFHLILDISGYGNGISRNQEDLSIDGLLEDDEIREVINFLSDIKAEGLAQITLCWLNVFNFDDKPRVFVYYTKPIFYSPKTKKHLDYKGWTIEFYPLGKEINKFKELRISRLARDKSWIKTSWFSTTDNLLTFGPEQRIGDQNKN